MLFYSAEICVSKSTRYCRQPRCIHFYAGKRISVSAIDCLDDRFSFRLDEHAICTYEEFSDTSITLWQRLTVSILSDDECNATINSSSCAELGLSSEWDRDVQPLRNYFHNLTCTFRRTETSCEVVVNASLTLHSIQKVPDTDPDYRVSLTVDSCPELSPQEHGHFSITVSGPRCAVDIPEPTETQLSYTFFELAQCPRMNTTFIGGVQDNVFTFLWKDSENKTVCFTAGQSKRSGRYMCGWTTNDPNTCNSTIWLSITNCTVADAGNYSVVGTKGDYTGQVTHVLLCKLTH